MPTNSDEFEFRVAVVTSIVFVIMIILWTCVQKCKHTRGQHLLADVAAKDRPFYEILFQSEQIFPTLPKSVSNANKRLSKIDKLYVPRYSLYAIPDSIGRFRCLTEISFSLMGLEEISPAIGELTQLTRLSVANNLLRTLPNSIGNLKKLSVLNASQNILESIPDTIGGLCSLYCLDLHVNRLTSIPETIVGIPNLSTLDLSYNDITSVPNSIRSWTRRPKIRLKGNLNFIDPLWGRISSEGYFHTFIYD